MIALMAICSKCHKRSIEWESKEEAKPNWKKGWSCDVASRGLQVIGYETPEMKFSYYMPLPRECDFILEQTIANEEYEELFQTES